MTILKLKPYAIVAALLLTLFAAPARCETVSLKTWFPTIYGGFNELYLKEQFRVGKGTKPLDIPLDIRGDIYQSQGNLTVIGKVGIGTGVPQALLDITSKNGRDGGLILPRLSYTSVASPKNGMLIYDTSSNMLKFYSGGWHTISTRRGSGFNANGGSTDSNIKCNSGLSSGYAYNSTTYQTTTQPPSVSYKSYYGTRGGEAYTSACSAPYGEYMTVSFFSQGTGNNVCPKYCAENYYDAHGNITGCKSYAHWPSFTSGTAFVAYGVYASRLTCYFQW